MGDSHLMGTYIKINMRKIIKIMTRMKRKSTVHILESSVKTEAPELNESISSIKSTVSLDPFVEHTPKRRRTIFNVFSRKSRKNSKRKSQEFRIDDDIVIWDEGIIETSPKKRKLKILRRLSIKK